MDAEAIATQMREILVLEVCTVDEQGKAAPTGRMYEMTRQEFLSTHTITETLHCPVERQQKV